MRLSLNLQALVAIAAAILAPNSQDIDFAVVDAAPDVVIYDPAVESNAPSATVTIAATTTPITTSNAYSTMTAAPLPKRDHDQDLPGLTTDSTNVFAVLIDNSNTTWYMLLRSVVTCTRNTKRALSTPDVLTHYPASVFSSACILGVTQATSTFTLTLTITTTVTASTLTSVTTEIMTASASPSIGYRNVNLSLE